MLDALLVALYVPFATEARLSARSQVVCGDEVKEVAENNSVVCASDLMRIVSHGNVDAFRHTQSAVASMPVLDARNAITEGTIALPQRDENWTSEIGIINPNASTAFVTVGDERLDVAPQAMRIVPAAPATFTASQPVLAFRVDTNAQSGARVITLATTIPRHRRAVNVPAPAVQTPHTITLTPSKDNTLYESVDGSISNGIGVHLFSGTTGSFSRRRAVLAFDLASQIPAGSTVTSVSLKVQVTKTIAGDEKVDLHALTQDWGEGASNAGAGRDGGGAAAKTNDATWLHTFFPDKRWTNQGGDFAAAADASVNISGAGSSATWSSSAPFVARVQSWVNQPSTNFGWIIIGNETTSVTTKAIDSREGAVKPALTIEYTSH
jgi:hypothetical protein